MIDDGLLHHHVLTFLVEHGHAPEVRSLAAAMQAAEPEIEAGLARLHDGHGLVLHPDSHRVWIAHPFANFPTGFWVTSARGSWWGNCAWCSLGVAALVGGDVAIHSTLGAESERVTLHVRDGRVVEDDLVVHFPLPPARAWENVVYYCSMVLLFRGEDEVTSWSERHAIPRGAVVPVTQVWELARLWYGRHLAPDWRKWTTAEAQEIFDRAGLRDAFWELPTTREHF